MVIAFVYIVTNEGCGSKNLFGGGFFFFMQKYYTVFRILVGVVIMAERTINLTRCLFQYNKVFCNRCEAICPQQAIHNRVVDETLCDDCGLCTAVCPTGAIQSSVDYDGCLAWTAELSPQVLMCRKVDRKGMKCLGGLNRRLLWSLAEKTALAIDTSRCQGCNPAVASWLDREIAACNAALKRCGRKEIVLVHVKAQAQEPVRVARRGFFRSLFRSTAQGVKDFTEEQTKRQYTFDSVLWLEKQQTTPNALFFGMEIADTCNRCGLCISLCPENALEFSGEPGNSPIKFNPRNCTACGLCSGNCPQRAMRVMPSLEKNVSFPSITKENLL